MGTQDVITRDELIDEAERRAPGFAAWVVEETGRREAETETFRSEPIEVEGGTLVVGRWYHVEFTDGWSARGKVRRLYNCHYLGRKRGRDWDGGPTVSLRFDAWSGEPRENTWPKPKSWRPDQIVLVTPTDPPAVAVEAIARRERTRVEMDERAAAYRAARLAMREETV